jgi:energy-coupling factor transporter ATP-binding protein EcfA2
VKLKRASIQNFKGVRDVEIDFQPDPHAPPRWLTALIGDNGSGKTTVLQAIALCLSLATRRTRRSEELRWHGFLAERLGSLGPTRVELEVAFDHAEIEQTTALFEEWRRSRPPEWIQPRSVVPPAALASVTLVCIDNPGLSGSAHRYRTNASNLAAQLRARDPPR